jgi:hypothetical protein
VSDYELLRRAGVAIRLAFKDDSEGHKRLLAYLDELDDSSLTALCHASGNLGDLIMDVQNERYA